MERSFEREIIPMARDLGEYHFIVLQRLLFIRIKQALR